MDGAALDSSAKEQRVVVLDGLRGMMTILVVISHYFGEVPHGISALMFGWIAVDMFFVLSGYLVGKLILEKSHHRLADDHRDHRDLLFSRALYRHGGAGVPFVELFHIHPELFHVGVRQNRPALACTDLDTVD